MNDTKIIKGYKVFNPDWTCRGFQYKVGEVYEIDEKPICCERGFHFCTKIIDCFNYYEFDPENKVAEVEAIGQIDTNKEDSKHCTNKIRIVREITWQEVLDSVNCGKGCTGFGNTGDFNSGGCNTGNYNTGDYNKGDRNTGNYNAGNRNSGNFNSGSYNTGYGNTGYGNSGYGNRGDYNIGSYNIGDFNIGSFNKASNCIGCFNIVNKPVFFFDKPSDWTLDDWFRSDAYRLMGRIGYGSVEWITVEDMTDEEKKQHPEAETTGGYLKRYNNPYCFKEWWDRLSDSEKKIIKEIPNFDADIFLKTTGIDVNNREGEKYGV